MMLKYFVDVVLICAGIAMIGCGIVDLLEDYSDEKRRRKL